MPNLKLGKKEARIDDRTITLKSILRPKAELPDLPDQWLFPDQYPQFDLSPQMWGNDVEPCCVETASYATQRDFEVIEQGRVLPITTDMVVNAYKKEAGGGYGLMMLDHLKIWKNDGIPIGTKTRKILCISKTVPINYQIYAFASIDWTNKEHMKYATMLLGCNIGVSMPDSYADQFEAGHIWDDTSLPPNRNLGHAMQVAGWPNDEGMWFKTWGRYQFGTWPWIFKFGDECYAIIDKANQAGSPVDDEKLTGFLDEIAR